jgi:hypothetical protein
LKKYKTVLTDPAKNASELEGKNSRIDRICYVDPAIELPARFLS